MAISSLLMLTAEATHLRHPCRIATAPRWRSITTIPADERCCTCAGTATSRPPKLFGACSRRAQLAQPTTRFSRILNDKRDTGGDWSEALPWLQYEWLPQAVASGVRAMAYLFSPDLEAQLVSHEFVAAVQEHIQIMAVYRT